MGSMLQRGLRVSAEDSMAGVASIDEGLGAKL